MMSCDIVPSPEEGIHCGCYVLPVEGKSPQKKDGAAWKCQHHLLEGRCGSDCLESLPGSWRRGLALAASFFPFLLLLFFKRSFPSRRNLGGKLPAPPPLLWQSLKRCHGGAARARALPLRLCSSSTSALWNGKFWQHMQPIGLGCLVLEKTC